MHFRHTLALILILLVLTAGGSVFACETCGCSKFKPLFDGKTLEGWSAMPGGKWEVKDGAILGTSARSERRHGLLVTDKQFADFEVRLKFKVVKGNSGFYFRSEKVKGAVGVHGFQAEVANEDDVGGLYETGGRAWVKKPDPALIQKTYKPGEWNEMSVTAVGRDVVVKLNGVKTVELKSDKGRLQGHIALQLHGGQDMEVLFKDIQLHEMPAKASACEDDGFKPMFNGKDLTGWRTEGNWVYDTDGTVTLKPRPGEHGWQRFGSYLITTRKYKDFVIDLDFKFQKGGNSGVFCRIKDPNRPVDTGFEVQILDTHGKKKLTHHDCGGIIRTVAASKNMVKPAGEWNHYTITVKGSQVTVVLNGERIVDIDISKTGLKDRPMSGYLGFQDEAKRIWYRNVRIKELTGGEGKK